MSSATLDWLEGGGVGRGADGSDENKLVTCPNTTPPKSAAASAMKRFIWRTIDREGAICENDNGE